MSNSELIQSEIDKETRRVAECYADLQEAELRGMCHGEYAVAEAARKAVHEAEARIARLRKLLQE